MPRNAEPSGMASWMAINNLINVLEKRYPGIRAATYARVYAALEDETGENAAAVREVISQKEPDY